MKISRAINAPVALVFDAWIKPEHIKMWWGPNGFTNTISEMDVKPGGKWELVMHGPDGTDYKNKSEYVEVIPGEKIVFDHISGPKYRMEVTFEQQNDATLLTIQMTFESEEQLSNVIRMFKADEGLKQNMERLEHYLNNNMEKPLVIERIYNAPIDMVWSAITDAEQMRKWYFSLADFKPEVGFEFSFEAGSKEKMYTHLCKVVDVVPGSRLSYTWRYEGLEGNSVVSFELFDENGKTRVRLTHEGIETMSANGPDFQRSSFMGGWTYFIDKALREYVENGKGQ